MRHVVCESVIVWLVCVCMCIHTYSAIRLTRLTHVETESRDAYESGMSQIHRQTYGSYTHVIQL